MFNKILPYKIELPVLADIKCEIPSGERDKVAHQDAATQMGKLRIKVEAYNGALFRRYIMGVLCALGSVVAAIYMIHRFIKAENLSKTGTALTIAMPIVFLLGAYLARKNYEAYKTEGLGTTKDRESIGLLLESLQGHNEYFQQSGLDKLRVTLSNLPSILFEKV